MRPHPPARPAVTARRVAGVRVLVLSRGRILLVRHEDPDTGRSWWVLPGGGHEPGETLAQAAVREVFEETGLAVRVLRRMRVPPGTPHLTYALFLAEPTPESADLVPAPTVDLAAERYLRAAAWHPITPHEPIGPLNPEFWAYLTPRLPRLLASAEAARPAKAAAPRASRIAIRRRR